MSNFNKVIKDIERTLNAVHIFSILITAVLIYLCFYLALSLLKIELLFALVPAILYLFTAIYRDISKDKIRLVEQRFPMLDERLKTARDNIYKENEIIKELQHEVSEDLNKIRLSSFVSQKKISYRMMAVIILCFVIVLLATLNINTFAIGNIADKSYIWVKDMNPFVQANGTGSGQNEISGSIYGDDTVGVLGQEKVTLELSTKSLDVDFRDVQEAKQQDFNDEVPNEIDLESSAAYHDDIPLDELELVKQYFENEVKR